MLNHIHLISRASDLSKVLCDFKKFTSREIMKNIIATEPSVAELFPKKNGKYKFWQETNYPQLIESLDFFEQKQNYIYQNPIRKQYVQKPEHWFWSSANTSQQIKITQISELYLN